MHDKKEINLRYPGVFRHYFFAMEMRLVNLAVESIHTFFKKLQFMKKTFLFMAAAVAMITACSKEADNASENGTIRKVNLVVDITGNQETKATGIKGNEEDEEKINSLQVFVFNGDIVDGYVNAVSTNTLTIGCTAGPREIYALVNVPDLSTITSKTQLLAKVSSLGNSETNFEMIGHQEEDIQDDNQKVTVRIDRFASRVKVKKITNALTSPALQVQTFTVKSVHITNVVGDIDYGMSDSYAITKWYNKMCLESSNNLGIITNDAMDNIIEAGESYSTAHCFYAYPNNANFSSSTTWSARASMLVLKIQIGSTLYNYPIKLPALEANKSYEIEEIKITRPGNLDDGTEGGVDEMEPVQGQDCQFEILVNPWTVVPVSDNPIII